jgi:large subunit ribosomal protein L9
MKVILTSRIKKFGEIGDIKEVADGYGKNYLLPKKLAMIYSDKNYKFFEKQRENIKKEDEKNKAIALTNKSKIESKEFVIIENAGDNDKLYGSINSVRIANFVNNLLNFNDIKHNDIIIQTPIKYLGMFEITFSLHPDVVFNKNIVVARSKDEAEKIKKEAKNRVSEAIVKKETSVEDVDKKNNIKE